MGVSDEREYGFSIERFTGIDQGMEGNDTAMHASRSAENCDTSGGTLKPAPGWAYDPAFGEAPGAILSLIGYVRNNADGSVTRKVLAATAGNLYQQSGTGWVSVKGALPVTSGRFSHVNYDRNGSAAVILANGTDNVYCWGGVGNIAKLAADSPAPEGLPEADAENNTIRLSNHGLQPGWAVVFYKDAGALPAGLAEDDTYFVKSADADAFKVGTGKTSAAVADIKGKGTQGWRVARANWLGIPQANAGTGLITVTGHGLEQGEKVVFDPWDGSLPGGISANTAYYAYVYDADRFYITTSPDSLDDRVDITSAGSNFRVRKQTQSGWVKGWPSASAGTDIITFTGHGLKDGMAVQFENGEGAVPEGLTAHDGTDNGKYYHVVKATRNTFKVAETPGGTPVNIRKAGSRFIARPSRRNRPAGGSLALHAERVWCAGDKTRPHSAFFSDDRNPSNWTVGVDGAGEFVNPSWDGDRVTAVANLFGSIHVFRANSLYRIAGTLPGEYQTVPVLSTAGTLSPATVCQWQNAAFFLSAQGIMAFDGTRCDRLGGDALKDTWARVNTDAAALAGACAAVHDGRLLTAIPVDGSAANNCVVEFDLASGTFLLRTGVRVDAWLPGGALRFASGSRVCLWGRGADGRPLATYGGAPVPMRWETPESDFGSRNARKTVTGVLLSGRGGALTVTVKADGRQAAKTATLPEAGGIVKAPVRIRGRRISIELANEQGSGVEITGITVLYEKEED